MQLNSIIIYQIYNLIKLKFFSTYNTPSAQARIRAKFKHISQRSAKTKTNQDSFSNGE